MSEIEWTFKAGYRVDPTGNAWMSVKQLADLLDVSDKTIQRRLAGVDFIKDGRLHLYCVPIALPHFFSHPDKRAGGYVRDGYGRAIR
jgi:hypothetical protein